MSIVSSYFSSRPVVNVQTSSFMDSIYAIAAGLAVRVVIDNVSRQDNNRLTGTLVGLWEGVVLQHFLRKMPRSFDPYVAYGVRLFIDFLFTESVSRLVLVLVWTCMGVILADVTPAIWVDVGLHRYWRRLRRDLYIIVHSLRLPWLSRPRTVRFTPSRAPSVISTAAPSVLTTTTQVPNARQGAATPGARKRPVPGAFPGEISETETDLGSLRSVLSDGSTTPGTAHHRFTSYPRHRATIETASEVSSGFNDLDEGNLSSSESSASLGSLGTSAANPAEIPDMEEEGVDTEREVIVGKEKGKGRDKYDGETTPKQNPVVLPPTPSDSAFALHHARDEQDEVQPPVAEVPNIPDDEDWENISRSEAVPPVPPVKDPKFKRNASPIPQSEPLPPEPQKSDLVDSRQVPATHTSVVVPIITSATHNVPISHMARKSGEFGNPRSSLFPDLIAFDSSSHEQNETSSASQLPTANLLAQSTSIPLSGNSFLFDTLRDGRPPSYSQAEWLPDPPPSNNNNTMSSQDNAADNEDLGYINPWQKTTAYNKDSITRKDPTTQSSIGSDLLQTTTIPKDLTTHEDPTTRKGSETQGNVDSNAWSKTTAQKGPATQSNIGSGPWQKPATSEDTTTPKDPATQGSIGSNTSNKITAIQKGPATQGNTASTPLQKTSTPKDPATSEGTATPKDPATQGSIGSNIWNKTAPQKGPATQANIGSSSLQKTTPKDSAIPKDPVTPKDPVPQDSATREDPTTHKGLTAEGKTGSNGNGAWNKTAAQKGPAAQGNIGNNSSQKTTTLKDPAAPKDSTTQEDPTAPKNSAPGIRKDSAVDVDPKTKTSERQTPEQQTPDPSSPAKDAAGEPEPEHVPPSPIDPLPEKGFDRVTQVLELRTRTIELDKEITKLKRQRQAAIADGAEGAELVLEKTKLIEDSTKALDRLNRKADAWFEIVKDGDTPLVEIDIGNLTPTDVGSTLQDTVTRLLLKNEPNLGVTIAPPTKKTRNKAQKTAVSSFFKRLDLNYSENDGSFTVNLPTTPQPGEP